MIAAGSEPSMGSRSLKLPPDDSTEVQIPLPPHTSPRPQQQQSPGQLVGVSDGQLLFSLQQVLRPDPVAQSLAQFSAVSPTLQLPFPHDVSASHGSGQAKQSNSLGGGHV